MYSPVFNFCTLSFLGNHSVSNTIPFFLHFPSLQPKVSKFSQVLNLAIPCEQVRKTWMVVALLGLLINNLLALQVLSLHFSQGELIQSHPTLCVLGKKPTFMFAAQTFLWSSTLRVSLSSCLLDYSPACQRGVPKLPNL